MSSESKQPSCLLVIVAGPTSAYNQIVVDHLQNDCHFSGSPRPGLQAVVESSDPGNWVYEASAHDPYFGKLKYCNLRHVYFWWVSGNAVDRESCPPFPWVGRSNRLDSHPPQLREEVDQLTDALFSEEIEYRFYRHFRNPMHTTSDRGAPCDLRHQVTPRDYYCSISTTGRALVESGCELSGALVEIEYEKQLPQQRPTSKYALFVGWPSSGPAPEAKDSLEAIAYFDDKEMAETTCEELEAEIFGPGDTVLTYYEIVRPTHGEVGFRNPEGYCVLKEYDEDVHSERFCKYSEEDYLGAHTDDSEDGVLECAEAATARKRHLKRVLPRTRSKKPKPTATSSAAK